MGRKCRMCKFDPLDATLWLCIQVNSYTPTSLGVIFSKDHDMANKGKVLVTGATGFVALHCIAELLKNGYEVVGTLRTKSREKEVKNGIEKVVSSKKLNFVETDLMHDSGWEEGLSLIHI